MPDAQIKDNTFSGLSGLWTHAIGLEGPTPGAVVSGNDFSGLTATSADNLAIHFEKNPVGNTVTIYHNKFNGSAFYGVGINAVDLPGGCNHYNYAVNSESNYWGDVSGPGPVGLGSGAKVGPGIDFQPWCNADFSNCSYYPTGTIAMQTSGTPAEVGDIVTMDSKVTVDGVYGMQLRVSFDATALEFQAPPASSYNNVDAAGWYWDTVPKNFAVVAGGRWLSGSMSTHPNPATLTGQNVATWKFKCLKAGVWALTYDQTPDFGTYLATKDGFDIPANLTGGSVTCLAATASVDGYIKLQGRLPSNPVPEAWQGADVKLTCVDTVGFGCNGFGPYTMTTDASGHYQHPKTATPGSGVVLGTYSATAARRAYLGAAKTANVVVVSGSNTINTLATAPRLLGGDVVIPPSAPLGITMSDLTAIGGAFGTTVTPADTGNDVNGDGAVNIFDLVLAGGNLDQPFPQPW